MSIGTLRPVSLAVFMHALQFAGAGCVPFPLEGQTAIQELVGSRVPRLLAARFTVCLVLI